MAKNSALFSKLDQALNSEDVHIQNSVITSLIQAVSRYVEQIKAEEEIIGQIRSFEGRVRGLRNDKSEEAQEDLKEAQELLEKAKELERKMQGKRRTIKELEASVKVLYSTLSRL